MYNKEAVLEAKLDKTLSTNEVTKHIKSLSDVKELKLTTNKAYKDEGPEKGDTYIDFNESPYACPVTAINMNGTNNFVVNWICGCVFSERALNELGADSCHGCGGPLAREQLITLYPDDALLKVYKERVVKAHITKKQKKIAADVVRSETESIKCERIYN